MKIRVQIPYGKFGVIEISDIEATNENLARKIESVKALINKHSKIEDAFSKTTKLGAEKKEFGSLKLSEAQIKAIKNNGWKSDDLIGAKYDELDRFFKRKIVEPVAPQPIADEIEIPWEAEKEASETFEL